MEGNVDERREEDEITKRILKEQRGEGKL